MKTIKNISMALEALCRNQSEELMQRAAWRLVRAAADRHGDGKGEKKLGWATARLQLEFPGLGDAAEDRIRAAYTHFKTERG